MTKLLLLEAGIVVLNDDTIKSIKFNKESIVEEFNKVINKQYDLSMLLRDIHDNIFTNNPSLNELVKEYGLRSELINKDEMLKFNEDKLDLMLRANLVKDKDEAISILREFAIKFSELKIKEASTRRDLYIIQSINSLDEYDKTINILSERIREWYGLHFPELSAIIEDSNVYSDIVLAGNRYELSLEQLKGISKAEDVLKAARESKGGDITSDSMNVLKMLAKDLKMLRKTRDAIIKYLEKEMEDVAPNIKGLVGANIGARLIARAGGLDKLAILPASTIQVLGAEKALFRALKTKGKPPKHGILFQHALIHSSPPWQRGKIARALATNLALAARIDLYKGIKDPELISRLEKRIEEIKRMPERKKEVKPVEKVDKKRTKRVKKRFGRKR